MIRRPLAEGHAALLRHAGEVVRVPEGTLVVRAGQPSDHFCFVLEGAFELYDPAKDRRIGVATLGPGQVIGEIAFLTGGAASRSGIWNRAIRILRRWPRSAASRRATARL